jgi:hypothetical protein
MLKQIRIKLNDKKGTIETDKALIVGPEDKVELLFNIEPSLLKNKFFYLVKKADSELQGELKDMKLEVPEHFYRHDGIYITIIMKSEESLYPEQFIVEPIRINNVFVIGKTLDEAYPEKILSIDEEIRNLKIALVSLSERIKELESVGDVFNSDGL